MFYSRKKFLQILLSFFFFPKILFAKLKSQPLNQDARKDIVYLENSHLKTSVSYVQNSPNIEKQCKNCFFYKQKALKDGPCDYPVFKKSLKQNPYVAANGYCRLYKKDIV
jgi:hypothetical protein